MHEGLRFIDEVQVDDVLDAIGELIKEESDCVDGEAWAFADDEMLDGLVLVFIEDLFHVVMDVDHLILLVGYRGKGRSSAGGCQSFGSEAEALESTG